MGVARAIRPGGIPIDGSDHACAAENATDRRGVGVGKFYNDAGRHAAKAGQVIDFQ